MAESNGGASAFDSPAMQARTPRADSATAELRGECPRNILNVLDAVSIARGLHSRTALVNEILGDWADKKRHELSLLQRLDSGNPTGSETAGGPGK